MIVISVAWIATPSRGCEECPFYNGADLTKALLVEAEKMAPKGRVDVEKFFKNTTYIMYSYVPGVHYNNFFQGIPVLYDESDGRSDGVWYIAIANDRHDGYYVYQIQEWDLCWDPELDGQRCTRKTIKIDGGSNAPRQKPKILTITDKALPLN